MPPDCAPSVSLTTFCVGGPGLCDFCGRTFSKGLRIDKTDALMSVRLCMWCLSFGLEETTGWQITNQMRSWLVARSGPSREVWQPVEPHSQDDLPTGM